MIDQREHQGDGMDARAYLPAFLADAREHVQELGLLLVRVEAAPDDRDATDGIFRVAHSLKGMSATMGFDALVQLTHAMEDVLDLLRQRAGGLPRAAVDVLSACLDALEAAVASIGDGDGERLDAGPLVERLLALARERTPEQELARDGDVALPDLTCELAAGERLLRVVAELDDACRMPAVRAFMLFDALRAHGELVGAVPAPEAVERFAGRRIEAWVATRADAEALAESARAVGELAAVRVAQERSPKPAAAAADAAERPAARSQDDPDPGRSASARSAGATVRVDAERLDELLHLMGELVQHRTTVEALAAEADVPGLAPAIQRLARTSQALQETVTRVRMVPVESVFLRFPRLVRDLAARLGKQVELRLAGTDTELDRTVVDALGDPLVHLVRNALDHGLEAPEERVAAGKPPTGVLELAARHAGGHVVVTVRDDGRGVDPVAVGRAAVERGLLDAEAAAALDLAGAAELLFAPGFSTAPFTTDLSGRGVGMDAVRDSVRALGGEVAIRSDVRLQGTTAELRLPLTLASIAALLVRAGGLPYAIPLERVVRTVRLDALSVRTVRAAPLLPLGGELLPLLGVDGHATRFADDVAGHAYAVIVAAGGRRVALAVDELAGQRELVTRRLPRAVSPRAAANGGAVLPDGQVALVLDCDALCDARNPGQPEGVPA